MSLPPSVADVIQQHVTLTVECLDRLNLNVIQPASATAYKARWLLKLPFSKSRQGAWNPRSS